MFCCVTINLARYGDRLQNPFRCLTTLDVEMRAASVNFRVVLSCMRLTSLACLRSNVWFVDARWSASALLWLSKIKALLCS